MNKILIVFLQMVVVGSGMGVLAFLLWEPWVEGRNEHATLFQVYFNDAFLAYAYTGSIAFFVAIYKTFRLLSYVGQNKAFSSDSVKALRAIKYCALIILAFIVPALAYLLLVRPGDDIAGGVAIGLFISIISVVVMATAAIFERVVHSVVDKISVREP